MEGFDFSQATEYGIIGIALVAVIFWLKSYVTKMDEHQNNLNLKLMELLTNQTTVMAELKNSITELTTYIKQKEDDGK